MLQKQFVELLFKAFSIERWNDKLRPIELIQMDKHAHKMMIAWCLAKYEEDAGNEFVWMDVIKGGIYELIRRIVISDIQSPVFQEISKNKKLLEKLNFMIFKEVEPKLNNDATRQEFEQYLTNENYLHPLSKKILDAAHYYSSYWEFQLVRNVNPEGYRIHDISVEMGNIIESFSDLEGIKKLQKKHSIKNFVDLVGELRYQVRWGHLPRIPKTSVLGHSMMVAILSYFLSKEMDDPCSKRVYNNFWTGIFHDLPEVVTRDIIKPIKRSVPGMQEEIKRIEKKLVGEEILPHLESSWVEEMKYYIYDEFNPKINDGQVVGEDEIDLRYNENKFNPMDGTLMKACDDYSAFLEAWNSVQFGIRSEELEEAVKSIKHNYKDRIISGIEINKLYEGF